MNLATEPQIAALRRVCKHVTGYDFEADLLKMAEKHGFPVAAIEQLTRAQATELLNRLDEINSGAARRFRR